MGQKNGKVEVSGAPVRWGVVSADAISKLLHTLYTASTYCELWPVFLRDFVRMLGVSAAGIICQDEKRVNYGYSVSVGLNPEMLRDYHTYYGKQDPQIPQISHIVPGRIYMGPECCPPEYFRRTEYFNDFARKYDISLYCAMPTSKTTDSLEAVTVYTGFQDELPGKEALDLIALMVPHLQSALHLRRRFLDLTALNCSLASALDLMEYGVVLLDSNGLVSQMNKSAERLLRAGEDFRVRARSIECLSTSESVELRSLIRAATMANGEGVASGGSMLLSRQNLRPLSATVAPLTVSQNTSLPGAKAVMFLYDPESQASPPTDLLQRGYGLTPAEARLALNLIKGHSLTEVAELSGVTHNTARSQLKSIFMKTGVRHQAELVRLLLRTHLNQ